MAWAAHVLHPTRIHIDYGHRSGRGPEGRHKGGRVPNVSGRPWDRDHGLGRLDDHRATTTDMHYRNGGFWGPSRPRSVDFGRAGRTNLYDRVSRWFPNFLEADQVTVRTLVANTTGYIDYVTVDDFLNRQLTEPFRQVSGRSLTANQIEFVDLIINYLTENGAMELDRLYESPFTDLNPRGVEGIFKPAEITDLFTVLNDIRARAA